MLKIIIFAVLGVAVLADEFQAILDRPELKEQLKKRCEKNGAGPEKADEIINVMNNFRTCVSNLVNADTLKNEINEAKPNGALDEVFKKYCAKAPQFKGCIETFLDGVRPCVDSNVREEFGSIKNGTDELIEFVCYKDGDRIALFIAEEGPQCLQAKTNEIRTCFENTKNSLESIEVAKMLTIQDRCSKFQEFKTCVVSNLESCTTPTPANMIDSLMEQIRKNSPCKAYGAA